MNVAVLMGAAAACIGLLWLEWRRPSRRHLLLRAAATICAVLGLCQLATFPERAEKPAPASETAVLWTRGAARAAEGGTIRLRFALPDAATGVPREATIVPDAGTLRRHFPRVGTLRIVGDGLDPAQIPALRGLRVEFQPPESPTASPHVDFLGCPHEIALGEPLIVAGHLAGMPPGGTLALSLEAPDGGKTEATAGPADAHGGADYTLRAAALPAVGRFEWRLRAGATDEKLGVSVVPPTLPRILVLESAPQFDTAALRRWFGNAEGALTIRTRVGKDVFRSAAARGDAPSFTAFDAPLLAGHDLVLADGRALADLPPPERTALATAVERTGVGLLVLADEALLPAPAAAPPADLLNLLPWKFTPINGMTADGERTVRLRWAGQTIPSEIPLPAAPFSLQLTGGQTPLVDDRQQRILAATVHRGRGQVAVTLVRDTSRFLRGGEPAAFAAYWSFLFSRLARPLQEAAGCWTLVEGGGPVFIDHPLALRWSGSPDKPPALTRVTTPSRAAVIPLPLAQDPLEISGWTTTFWPREPGWHQVADPSGHRTLDFYVYPAGSWPELQAERRRRATASFAAESGASTAKVQSLTVRSPPVAPGWWFTWFLVGVAYLWIERRFVKAI